MPHIPVIYTQPKAEPVISHQTIPSTSSDLYKYNTGNVFQYV